MSIYLVYLFAYIGLFVSIIAVAGFILATVEYLTGWPTDLFDWLFGQ